MILFAYIDPSPIITIGGGLAGLLAASAGLLGGLGALLRGGWPPGRRRLLVCLAVGAALLVAGGLIAWRHRLAAQLQPEKGSAMSNLHTHRLVVLGLDGLDAGLVEQFMAEGLLPNFSRLAAAGEYSRLATTNPPQSPVAWATFATGMNPGAHGLFDFIRRAPGSYTPQIATTRIEGGRTFNVRDGRAFWEATIELGIPAKVISCPVTFPPDPINGDLLAGMGVPDILGTQGTFTYFTTDPGEIRADQGGHVVLVEPPAAPASATAAANPRPAPGWGSAPLALSLPGPFHEPLIGGARQLQAEFTAEPTAERAGVRIEIQDETCTLAVGEWSRWLPVAFKPGPFKRMRGLVQFHLVELTPHFKLYATPVCLDPRDPWFPISHPPDYSRRLAAETGLFGTRGMRYETWGLNEGRISPEAFLDHANRTLEERKRIMRHELAALQTGLFFCYFDYPDVIQHLFWRGRNPAAAAAAPTGHPRAPGGGANVRQIREAYRKMDDLVGEVLAAIDPRDAIIILSDHGFTDFDYTLHLNTWLRRHGYLSLTDEALPAGGPMLGDVDWARTRAYALGFGAVYLNLKGREPDGIVEPGTEAESLLAEIARGLEACADAVWECIHDPLCAIGGGAGIRPPTAAVGAAGAAPVSRVYRGADIFFGQAADAAPDLFVGTARGWRVSWETAIGAVPATLAEPNDKQWSGTHLVDPELVPGILLTSFKRKETIDSIADLAPFIRRWMKDARTGHAAQ